MIAFYLPSLETETEDGRHAVVRALAADASLKG